MTTVRLQIPLESLTQAIASLNLEDKYKLLEMLKGQISEAEEELEEHIMGNNPEVSTEVSAFAYQASDYESIEDYIDSRSRQIS